MPCNPNMNLLFDDTLYEMINAELEQQFNCTVPFLPPITSKITGKHTDICKDPNSGLKALDTLRYLSTGGLSTISDYPCAGMDVFLGLPFIDSKGSRNTSLTKIYFKMTTKVKSTVLAYDFITVVAELGGYIGLLLGISVIDISLLFNSILVNLVRSRLTGTVQAT